MAVYFEAAAVITVLVLLGQVLELRAREATSGAIKALLDLAPKTARRIRADGTDEEVQIAALQVGDRLRVRPGEKVPVDGEIVEGRSSLDESMVTGESMPVSKEVGGKVIAGTLNRSGGFVMRAEKVGSDTMLSQIVQMVAQAQRSRAPIQRLADQVAGWFVPAVIVVAIAAFAVWAVYGPEPRFAFGLVAAVSVLIIACPCALGLGDSDVDHGRRRARRPNGRSHQERRSSRTDGADRHAGRRQDRHADRRQAEGGHRDARHRITPRPRCCGSLPVSNAPANIRLRDAIVNEAKERDIQTTDVQDFEFARRQGCARNGRGQESAARQCRLHALSRS